MHNVSSNFNQIDTEKYYNLEKSKVKQKVYTGLDNKYTQVCNLSTPPHNFHSLK